MNQNDYSEVLSYVRRRMRETDLAALDAEIAAGIAEHRDDPPAALLDHYLDALETHIRLRSPWAIRRVDERFGPVEIVITDSDRALLGIDRGAIPLSELALKDDGTLVEDLSLLRYQLRPSSEDLP